MDSKRILVYFMDYSSAIGRLAFVVIVITLSSCRTQFIVDGGKIYGHFYLVELTWGCILRFP